MASQASLDDLNSRLQSPVDMRRFRPNIVIEGTTPFEEVNYLYCTEEQLLKKKIYMPFRVSSCAQQNVLNIMLHSVKGGHLQKAKLGMNE